MRALNEALDASVTSSAHQDLEVSVLAGGILKLTLNRPDQRNSLSSRLLNSLKAAFEEASQARRIRVIILAAEGPAFCSGHDLKEMEQARRSQDEGSAFFDRVFRLCSDTMLSISDCTKPVIAQVQGVATAAGCQLAASCDLVVAGTEARFATPGVDIGLFCSTPMVALSRSVATKHAFEMLMTGDPISAYTAQSIGLVNRVVPTSDLERETLRLAQKIAAKPGAIVALGKKAFYAQQNMDLSGAYVFASEVMSANMMREEAEEGIAAFLEKRKPSWES